MGVYLKMNGLQPDIFIDAIILLTKCKDDKTIELVNSLLEIYSEEAKIHPENDTLINRSFVELLNKLKKVPNSDTASVERSSLLVQFLTDPVLQQDNLVYNSIKELFNNVTTNGLDNTQSDQIKKKLSNSILINKCNKICKRMFNKLSGCLTTIDSDKQDMYLNDAINLARSIVDMTKSSDRLASGAIERVDFKDKESLQKSLNLYREREEVFGLRTGLQGFNKMLGKRGTLSLGECASVMSLNHNFKSGALMTLARGIVKYNSPAALPGKGIPLILFISLENEANRNVMNLYKSAYEQTFHKSAEGLSDEEIITFLQEFYTSTGWDFIMERRDGGKFGYDEYVALIESYEAQGYWVVVSLMDYANKMKKGKGDLSKGNHNLVGDLFSALCTYHKTKGILFITAHQLNRNAQELANSGKTNVVKYFGPQHVADSLDVSRELDLEVFMHLERNTYGQRFWTCSRGKHRYHDDTPLVDQYFAYPFVEIDGLKLGIVDDIDSEPGFVRDIYSVPAPDGYDESKANNSSDDISMDDCF